uniref:Uncharacterized protein n=1 Tax=Glossina pallidipes TaxID=7398 RepID=A0A1B0AI91_GLOPL
MKVILSSQLDADFVSLSWERCLRESRWRGEWNSISASLLDFGKVFTWEKGYVNLKGQKVICEFFLPSCSTNWYFGSIGERKCL